MITINTSELSEVLSRLRKPESISKGIFLQNIYFSEDGSRLIIKDLHFTNEVNIPNNF
jgi:hypothetical protein